MHEIPREPLRTSIASESNDHRLRRRNEDVLALESRYDARAIFGGGGIFVLLGGAAYAASWAVGVPQPWPLGLLAIFLAGGVGYVVGLGLLHPLRTQALFDCARGLASVRGMRFLEKPTLPLKAVGAVQLCGPVEHSEWKSYQVNLVLAPGTRVPGTDAARKGRLNLLDNGGLDELIFIGRELATFLDVPFHDHRTTFE